MSNETNIPLIERCSEELNNLIEEIDRLVNSQDLAGIYEDEGEIAEMIVPYLAAWAKKVDLKIPEEVAFLLVWSAMFYSENRRCEITG